MILVDTIYVGIAILMHHISKTSVSASTWCSSHSSANFKNPDEFIPERWLAGPEGNEYINDHKLASRPFSMGPRGCIGKEYVYFYTLRGHTCIPCFYRVAIWRAPLG